MTMRDEFEHWYEHEFMGGLGSSGEWDAERNCYVIFQVNMAWKGYQAAYSSGQRANPWEQVFKDALVNHWIDGEHWADPQKAISALLQRAAQHALDPSISEAAQALIAQGQRAERDLVKQALQALEHCRQWMDDDLSAAIEADGAISALVAAIKNKGE